MTLEVSVASTLEDREACFALRRIVFIEEQNVPEAIEMDGEDDRCKHILARLGDVPVGAARYQYFDSYAKLQRVCVPAAHRGEGIGARLIQFMIAQINAEGRVSMVRLGSQVHALGFYEKLGFVAFGREYLDADIPHRDMELRFT